MRPTCSRYEDIRVALPTLPATMDWNVGVHLSRSEIGGVIAIDGDFEQSAIDGESKRSAIDGGVERSAIDGDVEASAPDDDAHALSICGEWSTDVDDVDW
mmetsp:Transcript_41321/g.100260  ORF Transcript_41321/g.100260 Transcript_41321/m.100260 type:complete len:100 (-) Transcript_41321:682-981(-)